MSNTDLEKVRTVLQCAVDKFGFQNGAMNFDLIVGKDEIPYIVEINPRNGGNMITNVIFEASGNDLVAAAMEAALGNNEYPIFQPNRNVHVFTKVLYAPKVGLLQDVSLEKEIQPYLFSCEKSKQKGELVGPLDRTASAVAGVMLKFPTEEKMFQCMKNFEKYVSVDVENKLFDLSGEPDISSCKVIRLDNTLENAQRIAAFLRMHRDSFVNLHRDAQTVEYGKKILEKGICLAWMDSNQKIWGMINAYANDMQNKTAYISTFVVDKKLRGKGMGKKLLLEMIALSYKNGMQKMKIYVNREHESALNLYRSLHLPEQEGDEKRPESICFEFEIPLT